MFRGNHFKNEIEQTQLPWRIREQLGTPTRPCRQVTFLETRAFTCPRACMHRSSISSKAGDSPRGLDIQWHTLYATPNFWTSSPRYTLEERRSVLPQVRRFLLWPAFGGEKGHCYQMMTCVGHSATWRWVLLKVGGLHKRALRYMSSRKPLQGDTWISTDKRRPLWWHCFWFCFRGGIDKHKKNSLRGNGILRGQAALRQRP